MSSNRPNILFIITDHHAYYGHDRPGEFDYKLPNFEKLAAEGLKFDRAYSVQPICTPARASMLTGVYPSKHGMIQNTGHRMSLREFRKDQKLFNSYLEDAGYRNAYVGKWHCGDEKLAVDYGWEGWSLPKYGKIYMSDAYKEYCKERGFGNAQANIEEHLNYPEFNGQTVTLHHESPWRFMNAFGTLEGPPEAHEEQFVAHLACEKMKELAANGQPWSLVASFWGPHHPYFPSEPFASMVDPLSIPEYPSFRDDLRGRPFRHLIHQELIHPSAGTWTEWSTWQRILARAYEQGYQTDAAVGSVLETLDELGQRENTIVVCLADHGDIVASHGGQWDKSSCFSEEVARVPMAIRWPTGFEGGKMTAKLVSNMDATATILDAAGIATPAGMDSRSLFPLCEEPDKMDWPDQLICEHSGKTEPITQRIIIKGPWKYIAAVHDGDEFYNLDDDPFEMKNLIDSPAHAGVLKELQREIIKHIHEHNDELGQRLALRLESGW